MSALDKKIQKALDDGQPLFWEQRAGGYRDAQVVAVTYTYENGRQRTKCLANYDARYEIEKIVALHKKYPSQIHGFDGLISELRWNGTVDKTLEQLLKENEDASV